jgi:hypothetical protein
MRTTIARLLPVLLIAADPGRADDPKPDPLEALKKSAGENWERLAAGPSAFAETPHALLVGPKAMEDKLKGVGELIEKHHDHAAKALFTGKEVPFKGRVTVYLLPEADMIDTFIRRIEKRRPLGREKGSLSPDDDKLFVAAAPPRQNTDPPVEVAAAQLVASLVLQRKAGNGTQLPDWLLSGFGRATYYRVSGATNKAVAADRQAAARLARMRSAQDVWTGVLNAAEAAVLDPALADFLAYGPGRMKFVALVEAFRPGENEGRKTTEQALQAVELKSDLIVTRFRDWLVRPN